MSIGNISLFDVYFSTLPYSLCVCVLVCIECVFVIANICVSVCVHVYEIERERGIDGRTDRWERVSLCRVSLFLCSVCWLHDCPYSSYTSPILPVQRGLHDCHSLLSPPPPRTHPHIPHTPTHRHRSASQSCVDCMTVWPVCVQRSAVSTFRRRHGSESRGLLRLFLGTPAPTQNHLACVCVQRPAVSTFRRHHG